MTFFDRVSPWGAVVARFSALTPSSGEERPGRSHPSRSRLSHHRPWRSDRCQRSRHLRLDRHGHGGNATGRRAGTPKRSKPAMTSRKCSRIARLMPGGRPLQRLTPSKAKLGNAARPCEQLSDFAVRPDWHNAEKRLHRRPTCERLIMNCRDVQHRSRGRRVRRTRRPSRKKLLIPRLEPLVIRRLLSGVDWIYPGSGDWNAGSNRSTGAVREPNDEVVINVSGRFAFEVVQHMLHGIPFRLERGASRRFADSCSLPVRRFFCSVCRPRGGIKTEGFAHRDESRFQTCVTGRRRSRRVQECSAVGGRAAETGAGLGLPLRNGPAARAGPGSFSPVNKEPQQFTRISFVFGKRGDLACAATPVRSAEDAHLIDRRRLASAIPIRTEFATAWR